MMRFDISIQHIEEITTLYPLKNNWACGMYAYDVARKDLFS